jgi:hypothetical protein
MIGVTRGLATLAGAAIAGFLVWLSSQMDVGGVGGYWARYGLIAAAGLVMALSQVLGGWTKWGWPRVSLWVLVLGLVPVATVGLWVLGAEQPGDPLLTAWSEDLGLTGFVDDMGEVLPVVAFGIGLTLGFVFDTTGPSLEPVPGEAIERTVTADERAAADEPLTADPSGPSFARERRQAEITHGG